MSQPGFYFYPGDWLKDTRSLDPFNRGLWIDTLCLLNEHAGSITWPIEHIAQFLGVDTATCHAFVTLLSRLNTASVTLHVTGDVTLTSRRMVREHKARESGKLRKQRERDRQARHRNVTPLSHENPAPLLNPSPSPSTEEEIVVSPNKEIGDAKSASNNGAHQPEQQPNAEPLWRHNPSELDILAGELVQQSDGTWRAPGEDDDEDED